MGKYVQGSHQYSEVFVVFLKGAKAVDEVDTVMGWDSALTFSLSLKYHETLRKDTKDIAVLGSVPIIGQL